MWGKASGYRAYGRSDRRRGGRICRKFLHRTAYVFYRDCGSAYFCYNIEKDEDVFRKTGSVCNGTSAVSYAAGKDSSSSCMGETERIHDQGGNDLFLACIVMWFLGGFGFSDGKFGIVQDSANSLLAMIGGALAVLFKPLGFGEWQPVAAALSGFTAKEAIVTTMGVLANVSGDVEDTVNVAGKVAAWFPSAMAAFSFLLFNLLDSPCLAAIATMAQQMQSRKWFWFAVVFQNVFAYVVSLSVYQIGTFVLGGAFTVGTAVGIAIAVILLILLFRPDPYKNKKIYSKRSVQAA